MAGALQRGRQRQHQFGDELAQQEVAALRAGAVDGDLLEARHQVGRALQVAQHDGVRFAGLRQVGFQFRAAQAVLQARLQGLRAFGHGGGHHQAVADRRIEFMRDAGHQRAQRGQLVAPHQFILGDRQVFQGRRQFAVGLFRLFLGQGQRGRALGHQVFQVGAVALQFLLVAHAGDRDAGQVGRHVDQHQFLRHGAAHFAVVHGERAEYLLVLAEDGLRPAGAQAERGGHAAVGRPQGIVFDVADDHRLAEEHGGAAGADAGADLARLRAGPCTRAAGWGRPRCACAGRLRRAA